MIRLKDKRPLACEQRLVRLAILQMDQRPVGVKIGSVRRESNRPIDVVDSRSFIALLAQHHAEQM